MGSRVGSTMIRLEGVTKRYSPAGPPAVDDLSLEVEHGEITVLVGPSGCGKTTTLKMINRLVEPTSGRIVLDGRDIRSLPAHELRRGVGYVIQQIGLFPHRTVAENIATVPDLLGWDRSRIERRVEELVDIVGLEPEMRERYPAELSGGQRQRVGVARALAADPPVLLMDEPFGAVDPIVRARLQQELLQLQSQLQKTIVFVTHDVDEAIVLGDRIAILKLGGVLARYGSPEEVLRDPQSAFVAEFLGSDRGLKRLSLIPVTDADLERGPVVTAGASAREAESVMAEHGVDWVGVLDGERMQGWVEREDLREDRPVGELEMHDFAVWIQADASLRDALDAVVNTRNQVAVVYDGDRYVGMLGVEGVSEALLR